MDDSATSTRKRRKGWDQKTPAGRVHVFTMCIIWEKGHLRGWTYVQANIIVLCYAKRSLKLLTIVNHDKSLFQQLESGSITPLLTLALHGWARGNFNVTHDKYEQNYPVSPLLQVWKRSYRWWCLAKLIVIFWSACFIAWSSLLSQSLCIWLHILLISFLTSLFYSQIWLVSTIRCMGAWALYAFDETPSCFLR